MLDGMNNQGPGLPQFLTEEEVEQKAQMIKAAGWIAESVNELKTRLDAYEWRISEQASLTLFNTLLMTMFSNPENFKQADEKKKEINGRIEVRAMEILIANGYTSKEVNSTCIYMAMSNQPEDRISEIWEEFYGTGTKSYLFFAISKAVKDLEIEGNRNE